MPKNYGPKPGRGQKSGKNKRSGRQITSMEEKPLSDELVDPEKTLRDLNNFAAEGGPPERRGR